MISNLPKIVTAHQKDASVILFNLKEFLPYYSRDALDELSEWVEEDLPESTLRNIENAVDKYRCAFTSEFAVRSQLDNPRIVFVQDITEIKQLYQYVHKENHV